MAKEITTEFIAGGTCPYCGKNFIQEYGKRNFSYNIRKFALELEDESGGDTKMHMCLCRTCWPLSEEDKQWLLDCHIEYYKGEGIDYSSLSLKE